MNRARRLTAADEVRLARRIARGDLTARDELVTANLRLVQVLARPYRDRGASLEDLVQEGSIGLIHAADRFDPGRGVRFATYAAWWIRRSILDALAAAQAIPIPSRVRRRRAAVLRAEDELRRRTTVAPSEDEIAEYVGLSPHTVRALHAAPFVTVSLDAPAGEDATPLGELIADPEGETAFTRAERAESHRELCSRIALLPVRHREVLVRRYGLQRTRAQGHDEIAARLGVGEQRSRQIEHEALRRLRSLTFGQPIPQGGTS